MHSCIDQNRKLAKRYDDWMVALHYMANTRYFAQRVLRAFIKFLGERPMASVTHVEIRNFLTHLSAYGATLETTYRHLGVLRRFYDFLSLGGVVSYVPPRLVRMKHLKRTVLPVLSEREVKRLLAATRTKRERALVEFIYGTGCRLRESTHLRVEDINFENRTARVHGKFGKDRIVFLPVRTIGSLRTYLAGRTTGYVFQEDRPEQNASLSIQEGSWIAHWVNYGRKVPSGTYASCRATLGRVYSMSPRVAHAKFRELLAGVKLERRIPNRPLHNATVLYLLNKIGHRAGLKYVGVHTLRRCFATHLYDRGAPIEIIQALLGHVYLGTTLSYTRLSRRHLAEAIKESHPLALPYEKQSR